MKWKEILIGAMASLIVTVIGGIALYYLTKEKSPDEELYHIIKSSSSFQSDSQNITIIPVEIVNFGGKSSENLYVKIELKKAEIKDYAIESQTAIKADVITSEKNVLELKVATLLSKERFTVNVLSTDQEVPSVIVKSSKTLGKSIYESSLLESKKKSNIYLEKSIPVIGVVYLVLVVLLFKRIKRMVRVFSRSENDLGFLLLHQGVIDDAENILKSAINQGKEYPYTIANMAVCLAKKGEVEKAKKYILAAKKEATTKHGEAVVLFCDALVELEDGNKDIFYMRLEGSMKLSKKSIVEYCLYSSLLSDISAEEKYQKLVSAA